MLNIDIFSDFISVGARNGISKYASAILNEDYSSGMSGYDVDEFIKFLLNHNNKYTYILENFTFDSESGMFCMYYKHEGGNYNVPTTQDAINKCAILVRTINELIYAKYIQLLKQNEFNTEPYIHFTNDYLKSKS